MCTQQPNPSKLQVHPSPCQTQSLQRRSFRVHPRLCRTPVDSAGRYVKVPEPDITFPYLAFSVDDFDDDDLEHLILKGATDEFAVVLHVRLFFLISSPLVAAASSRRGTWKRCYYTLHPATFGPQHSRMSTPSGPPRSILAIHTCMHTCWCWDHAAVLHTPCHAHPSAGCDGV